MPLEDIRAVVIAAKGVSLSSSLLSVLLEQDAVIVHCDDKFLPVGITAPLQRLIDREAAFAQAQYPSDFHTNLWHEILSHKVFNQSQVARYLNQEYRYLLNHSQSENINEALCARYYWRRYFGALGHARHRRQPGGNDFLNSKLDYGYAVIAGLCHRSIVVHGLNPVFGIYHKTRYRANPLVYDLMEPLRAFIDKALYDFLQEEEGADNMKAWSKFCARSWQKIKVEHKEFSLRLIDAIDYYISSVARAFAHKDRGLLWVPRIHLQN